MIDEKKTVFQYKEWIAHCKGKRGNVVHKIYIN